MLLGIKSKTALFWRHVLMALISASLVYLVWQANSTWSPDMRLWKAFGGGSFVLLWFTVFIGPAGRLWKPLARLITWRRESGIWFVLVGLVHGYLVLDGWVRWSVWEFLGYQLMPELGVYLRAEPGFGLANLIGLTALLLALALAATSSDKAVSFLGIGSWKWLHMFAYAIFYLSVLHVIYYAFMHYDPSPQRVMAGMPTNYPVNPLRFYYLAALLSVSLAQSLAFIKTVIRQRGVGQGNNLIQKMGVWGIGILLMLAIAVPGGAVLYKSRTVDTPGTASAPLPDSYAKSFHMVVRDGNQEIHLWTRNLDSEPYFKETVIVGGSPISHQIYRFNERAMYTAKLDESGQMTWSKSENMEPNSVGLSGILAGPGAWAAQYGKGEHQINFNNRVLPVTILSVDEAIDDEIFKLPNFSNSASPAQ